jgi:hypothetical protein
MKNIRFKVEERIILSFSAAQFLRVISDSTALTESQNLSMFLATNDKIRTMLKTSLAQIEGKSLVLILNFNNSLF